jgi:hypothetical protein
MLSDMPKMCGKACAKNVYSMRATALPMCSTITQLTRQSAQVCTSMKLCTELYVSYTKNYPLINSSYNGGADKLIPTMHRPNNKNYIGNGELNKGETVEKEICS